MLTFKALPWRLGGTRAAVDGVCGGEANETKRGEELHKGDHDENIVYYLVLE